MKTKMVSYTPETLPPLTKVDRVRLKALAPRPDSEIDTSDIPEMTEEQWKHARRGHFYRPRKRQITARVDADVLDWLKALGKGLPIPNQRDPTARDANLGEIGQVELLPACYDNT
jgi:uncharacterized protein (DUF4415 family)